VRGKRTGFIVLVGTLEGIRQLVRPNNKWADDIKLRLEEIGVGSVDWINMSQNSDKLKGCCENSKLIFFIMRGTVSSEEWL
jgi:hypothetical protein